MKRGLFIVFEGVDRSGKTTQAERLADALRTTSNVLCLRFPNRDTPTGQLCSAYLRNELQLNNQAAHMLFSTNRWEANEKIKAWLDEGNVIVCDRFTHSGIAYSTAKGVDLNWCKKADNGMVAPDIVIYLRVDASHAARRAQYGAERFEQVEFQRKVSAVYENKLLKPDWIVVDGSQPPDVVATKILAAVAPHTKTKQ